MAINRSYFRLSDLAYSQHETALVQATNKLLALGKTSHDKIVLFRAQAVVLGNLLVTGVYDGGAFKYAVITKVDESTDNPLTTTATELVYGLPASLS